MIEELDDNEFFQQDFTTASEWEVFNARLEEQFHEWKLPYAELGPDLQRNQLSLCSWNIANESVFFADVELNITRYVAQIPVISDPTNEVPSSSDPNQLCQAFRDLMSLENNYSILGDTSDSSESSDKQLHPLARWYGLRDFVVVSPVKKSITNESQIRILLSSIQIAAAESNCEIPVFVQAMEKRHHVYAGVCENRLSRLSYDIVSLATTPLTCKYLTGLLDMFKGKIGKQYVDPVTVSVRLAYGLRQFPTTNYLCHRKYGFSEFESTDNEGDSDDAYEAEELDSKKPHILPFGVSIDPIVELCLFCTWPQVAENVVIDSQNYSDFDPLLAPIWSLRSHFLEHKPICFMSECVSEYLQLAENRRTLAEILGDSYNYSGNDGMGNSLDSLTVSKISTFNIGSVLPTFQTKPPSSTTKKCDGPINEVQLMQMLYFMFPDAQTHSPNSYFISDLENFDVYKIKSAYPDSLVHRMSQLLALCNTYFGGQRAMAQLWAEFSQEMRFRVERCIQIPGVLDGACPSTELPSTK